MLFILRICIYNFLDSARRYIYNLPSIYLPDRRIFGYPLNYPDLAKYQSRNRNSIESVLSLD